MTFFSCSYFSHHPLILPLQNGGDLTLLDGEKHSPQYYARQYQDILSILSANGCVDDLSDASSNVEFTSSYQQQ